MDLPADATAVIVVDMQNDFAHPEGALYGEDGIAALTAFDKTSALRQVSFLYNGRVTTGAGVRFDESPAYGLTAPRGRK